MENISFMTPRGMDALRVVAEVNVNDLVRERDELKVRLAEAERALHVIEYRATEDSHKYCDLVWFARTTTSSLGDQDIRECYNEILEKYPRECDELRSDYGDWSHGFNSGVLACARMYSELADICDDQSSGGFERRRNESIEEFPMLDR